MESIKNNWVAWLIVALITLGGNMLFSAWKLKRDKVDNAAPMEYVDERDNAIIEYSDKQDNIIRKSAEDRSKEYDTKFNHMYQMIVDLWKDKHE